jgi:NADH dehydrogenase/NADH:ubiquinone oxidoreductase subunit G
LKGGRGSGREGAAAVLSRGLYPWGACGICVVKVEGSPKMMRACATPCSEGMQIKTHDTELYDVRRTVLQLILSRHPNDCLRCARNGNCELQTLAEEFGIREFDFPKRLSELPIDNSTPSIEVNPVSAFPAVVVWRSASRCRACGRLEFLGRGDEMRIAPAADVKLNDSPCIKCGQCSAHCPVGAIYEKSDSKQVHAALADEQKYCVVQIAPAVRVAIGEAFGYDSGELLTGKLYAALAPAWFQGRFRYQFLG